MWNQSISFVGASTSSMFMNIPPVIAIIIPFFVLGDPIRLTQIGGGLLILTGVALSNRWKRDASSNIMISVRKYR